MMSLRIPCFAVSLAILLATPLAALAALPPGISGAWYNPAQSGHGLSIEILSDTNALVFWYTFDDAGKPLTLYIEGRIEGDSITGPALAPDGPHFGEFNPADLRAPRWGEVTLDFSSCDSATLSWNADGEAGGVAYGAGALPLKRLSRISESGCLMPQHVPVGKYRLTGLRQGVWGIAPGYGTARAAVDPEGQLWALERRFDLHNQLPVIEHGFAGYPDSFPSRPQWRLLIAGDSLTAGRGALMLDVRNVSWANPKVQRFLTSGGISNDESGVRGQVFYRDDDEFRGLYIERRDLAPDELTRQITLSDLAGTYRYTAFDGVTNPEKSFEIRPDGSICVQYSEAGDCTLGGEVSIPYADYAFFDFVLDGALGSGVRTHIEGRGWIQTSEKWNGGKEAILTARTSGDLGFGLIGESP